MNLINFTGTGPSSAALRLRTCCCSLQAHLQPAGIQAKTKHIRLQTWTKFSLDNMITRCSVCRYRITKLPEVGVSFLFRCILLVKTGFYGMIWPPETPCRLRLQFDAVFSSYFPANHWSLTVVCRGLTCADDLTPREQADGDMQTLTDLDRYRQLGPVPQTRHHWHCERDVLVQHSVVELQVTWNQIVEVSGPLHCVYFLHNA